MASEIVNPIYILQLLALQIMSAVTQEELKAIVVENMDLMMDSGITKPFTQITMDDKVPIVQSVALQCVVLRTLGELTQFHEGLESLGVAKEMCDHSDLLHKFYVRGTSKVTAGMASEPTL